MPAAMEHESLESGKFRGVEELKVVLDSGPLSNNRDCGMQANTGQGRLLPARPDKAVPHVVRELLEVRKSREDRVEGNVAVRTEEFEDAHRGEDGGIRDHEDQ